MLLAISHPPPGPRHPWLLALDCAIRKHDHGRSSPPMPANHTAGLITFDGADSLVIALSSSMREALRLRFRGIFFFGGRHSNFYQ